MSIHQSIVDARQQAIPVPKPACAACQRQGLPILLLRSAYAPTPETLLSQHLTHEHGAATLPMRTDQPRTLRQGYVYVLLDRRVWHAYQVTPEGALRQFPALQPPREAGKPLSIACRQQHHDVIASFININTQLYATAWIAFANDPWPKAVLDQYQRAVANNNPDLAGRFLELDLKTARDAPASLGIAMTENNLQLGQVLEYAVTTNGHFNSTHGLYLRLSRLAAMRTHIRTLVQQEKLSNGVLALTLPDPIGRVQELNAQRLRWVQALQEWRAEPQRHFEHFTSQALLGIRELHDAQAAAQAAEQVEQEARDVDRWNDSPYLAAKAPRPAVDIEAQTQRRVAHNQQQARERLEERYDEAARAAFAANYDTEAQNRQKLIDRIGALYAEHYTSVEFQRTAYYDYSPTDWRSAERFVRMMSTCLSGGPTETVPVDGTPLSATQRLWQRELEDTNSLLYQALVARHTPLLQQLAQALSSHDLSKVYDTVKGLIGSDEGQQLMVKPVRDAIGQLLAATASAGGTLHQHLSAEAHQMIGHVHSAALLRYAGQAMTQLIFPLRAGEYLKLLNESLQERTDALLDQLDQQFRKPAERKIRAMVLSGAITATVSSKHGKVVELALWSMESAEELQARLQHLQATASDSVDEALRGVRIGTQSLQHHAAHSLRLLNLSAEQARTLAKDSMISLRSGLSGLGPGRGDLLLSLGGLWFQQDSLRRNYDTLVSSPGNAEPEALAAIWSSSIGVAGMGTEAAGKAIQILRPNWTVTPRTSTLLWGTQIAKYGGAIASIAGLMDAAQYMYAASRAENSGDHTSKIGYRVAGGISILSAVFGVSTLTAGSAFLGPLGIALILGFAAYAIAVWATKNSSSTLENWVRQTIWGKPISRRNWQDAHDFDSAIGALNAALLGMSINVSIRPAFEVIAGEQAEGRLAAIRDNYSTPLNLSLNYKIVIPNFRAEGSKYTWSLSIFEPNNRIEPLHFEGSSEENPNNAQQRLNRNSPQNNTHKAENKSLIIQDHIPLKINQTISALKFTVMHWPDNANPLCFAKLELKKDKLS